MHLPLEFIIEALAFLIVAALTFAGAQELERVLELRRRLGEQRFSSTARAAPVLQQRNLTNPFFLWVQASTSISDSKERQKLRQELSLAGIEHPAAPIWFVIVRFLLAVGLPLGFLAVQSLFAKPMSSGSVIFWALVLCCVGLLAPRSILDRRVAARCRQLEFEFPDVLDLMVVCVEAGLSIEAAFVRVGVEMRGSHPLMSNELARLSEELRAGRTRADALRTFGDRTGVSAVKSFTTLIIQTEVLGTSIGQTLRTYSTEMRQTRFINAEEKALRIPVMMTVPLVICILPVIVTALLLPAIIDVVRILSPALTNHGGG
jgi:tight adherence protein C